MSWVDAIVFALVAVYFINLFFFQNYVIPSSSLEKSLLTGDYLFVSKVSYGPRIPETPLTMPLTQHTMPLVNVKSYLEWPHWDYRRVKGLGNVKLNDIVVFNYPAGDTLVNEERYQAQDYYQMVYSFGEQILDQNGQAKDVRTMNPLQQRRYFEQVYNIGRSYIANTPGEYGDIISRPTDRRENYVKRCVGLPGQTLQIKNRIVYLDGKANKELLSIDQYPPCYQIIPSLTRLTVHSWMSALQTERLSQKTDAIEQRVRQCNGDWENAYFVTLARNYGFGINGDAFEQWALGIPLHSVDHHTSHNAQVSRLPSAKDCTSRGKEKADRRE